MHAGPVPPSGLSENLSFEALPRQQEALDTATYKTAINVYFVIRRNPAGYYWWRAVGNNNKILAASELMSSKAACLKSIAVVKTGAARAPIRDRTSVVKRRGSV